MKTEKDKQTSLTLEDIQSWILERKATDLLKEAGYSQEGKPLTIECHLQDKFERKIYSPQDYKKSRRRR